MLEIFIQSILSISASLNSPYIPVIMLRLLKQHHPHLFPAFNVFFPLFIKKVFFCCRCATVPFQTMWFIVKSKWNDRLGVQNAEVRVSGCRHHKRLGEAAVAKMGLQTFRKNRYWQCRYDVLWHIFPQPWNLVVTGKVCCRWLISWYIRQAMAKQSGDADGPRHQMNGGIPQRRTMEPSGVDICTPGQPAWTRWTAAHSASAAVWGRHDYNKYQTVRCQLD